MYLNNFRVDCALQQEVDYFEVEYDVHKDYNEDISDSSALGGFTDKLKMYKGCCTLK